VFENVAFALRVRNWPKDQIKGRVHELLKLIRLEDQWKRFPSQLSGGQRQRVALARSLAAQPRVLLLDEPFGALDAKVRQELRHWLRTLHDDIGVTSVFVTHDQEEAFEVADTVVVMHEGRIEQTGSPQEVFDHPATPFVMDFLGKVNVFHGRLEKGRAVLGKLNVDWPGHSYEESRSTKVYVRPHELDIEHESDGESSLKAKVLHIISAGSVVRVQLQADEPDNVIQVDLSPIRYQELDLKTGSQVYVAPRRIRVFSPDANRLESQPSWRSARSL
jgi:sulfate transport system ATP-binding protein